MAEVLTPDQVWEMDLPKLPWRRAARIRELAQPMGGLSMNLTGNLLEDLRPTEAYDIPTRRRLARKAAQVQIDNGIKNFAVEQGIDDLQLAEQCYCIGRLFGEVNPDGSLVEREPEFHITEGTIQAIREQAQQYRS